jgi:hypothetical protein
MINDETTSGNKNNRIYNLLESIENNQRKREKFVSWFKRMSWYIDAKIPFSEGQLTEIIEFLENLKKEP